MSLLRKLHFIPNSRGVRTSDTDLFHSSESFGMTPGQFACGHSPVL